MFLSAPSSAQSLAYSSELPKAVQMGIETEMQTEPARDYQKGIV